MEHKHDDNHSHGHHPLVPLKVYYATLGALIVLTVLTVGASYVNFGSTVNVFVSLGIASAKASLVLLFFMGLKYDTNLNRTVILSSFGALLLLIVISAADLWTRPQPAPVKVTAASGPLSQEEFDKMMAGGADFVNKGKAIYDVNCAVCHGAEGHGDGVGGAALNPHPRNFTAPASQWKNGISFKSIYVTLAYGIPGSGMASYKALPVADRVALVHYVLSMAKDVQGSAAADGRFAQALKEDDVGAAGAGPAQAALPIDFAIDQILKN